MKKLKLMKELNISLPLSDWLDLCAIHEAIRAMAVKNLGSDPINYSKVSRITNEIESQVTKAMADELMQLLPKSSGKD